MGITGQGDDKRGSHEPDDRKSDGKQRQAAQSQGSKRRREGSSATRERNLEAARQLQINPRRTRRRLGNPSEAHERSRGRRSRTEETGESSSATQARSPTPQRWPRRPIPPDWRPPLAVGASLGENLSLFEEAERTVLQWEAILENARRTQPRADLSPFERKLEEVRREFEEMSETEENMVPFNELTSTKQYRIQERLMLLEETLERTQSDSGQVNIRTAIEAYGDGRIQCWDKWTLIYAGHIVDVCPSYQSFTRDRSERLDRYFDQHGAGWLWFEPPLVPKDDPSPERLLAATWAQPHRGKDVFGGAGGWDITMGFRRVLTFHSRTETGLKTQLIEKPSTNIAYARQTRTEFPGRRTSTGKSLTFLPKHTGMRPEEEEKLKWSAHDFDDEDDDEGARVFFQMHLDSGASLPTLYPHDLECLGIDPHVYPPQSTMRLSTANGIISTAVYEMRVDICRHNGESLVGDNPVWPRERHEIGGIVIVGLLEASYISGARDSGGLTMDQVRAMKGRGKDVSDKAMAERKRNKNEMRLSGLLPFQVCYSAGAPGMNLWFGEDRRDVLGMDKMPGQRRLEWHKSPKFPSDRLDVDVDGCPVSVAFRHQLGPNKWVEDRDVMGYVGTSIMTVTDGSDVKNHRLEPRRLPCQQQEDIDMIGQTETEENQMLPAQEGKEGNEEGNMLGQIDIGTKRRLSLQEVNEHNKRVLRSLEELRGSMGRGRNRT